MKKIIFVTTIDFMDFNFSGGFIYSKNIYFLLREIWPINYYYLIDKPFHNKVYRQISSLFKSLFSKKSAKILYFNSKNIKLIRETVKNLSDKDILIIDHLEASQVVLDINLHCKIIYIAHNYESKLYKQLIYKFEKIPVLFHLLMKDLEKFQHFEEYIWKKANGIISISEEETNIYKRFNSNVITVYPFFSYEPFVKDSKFKNSNDSIINLGYIGNLDWWPNREGLDKFINEVFFKLKNAKRYRFHIFGKGSEKYDGIKSNIFGYGFVEKINKIWEKVDIFIHPIEKGGGINIKVAETLYNGFPIIGTRHSIRGLPISIIDQKGIVITDSIKEMKIVLDNLDFMFLLKTNTIPKDIRNLFSKDYNRQKIKKFLEQILGL